MKTLFFRSAIFRRKEFQLKTKIMEDGSNRYVIKEAIYEEGIPHIINMFSNVSVIEALYDKEMICEAKVVEKKLIVPFYKGMTLKQKLLQCIHDNDKQGFVDLMTKWKEIVMGKADNFCEFEMTKGFVEIFGNADELVGENATRISNVDCTCDNIIVLENGQIKILDYEWVYAFPIPIDFIWYRVLRIFYETSSREVSWNTLILFLDNAESKIQIFDRMMNKFNQYISMGDENNIDYARLGMQFLCQPIEITDKKKNIYYEFCDEMVPQGSTIILYGFGKVGRSFYEYIQEKVYCNIVAICDKHANRYRGGKLNIITKEDIQHYQFDYILIAMVKENVAQTVREELCALGVPDDKILWFLPKKI